MSRVVHEESQEGSKLLKVKLHVWSCVYISLSLSIKTIYTKKLKRRSETFGRAEGGVSRFDGNYVTQYVTYY